MAKPIDIIIQGPQGVGKSGTFDVIVKALENEGYKHIPLLPIINLDQERSFLYKGDSYINLSTIQTQTKNG